MFFEKTKMDSAMQLLKFGVQLKAVKYIINCEENVESHTIDVNVCVYDKSSVAKERLFDALEKMVATEPKLRVCFSNEKRFCVDKPDKTELQEHKHRRMKKPFLKDVHELGKRQKTLPPRTAENVGHEYEVYDSVFCDWGPILAMPLEKFKDQRDITRFPRDENINAHAQATDDVLFENRARDERSYSDEHGLFLMSRLHDNAPDRTSYFYQSSETRYVNESEFPFPANLAHPEQSYSDISSREDDDLTYGDSALQRHIAPTNEISHYELSHDGHASVATRLNVIPSANLLSSSNRQHGEAVQNVFLEQTPISSSPIAETRVLPNSFTQTCDRQLGTGVQNESFAQNPPQITFQVFQIIL